MPRFCALGGSGGGVFLHGLAVTAISIWLCCLFVVVVFIFLSSECE